MVRTLDSLIAHDGRLVEPLRKGITPPTADELAGWEQLPPGATELSDQGARPKDARAAEEFYPLTLAEPSLDVNGIATGSPHLQKTVLPVEAVANVSIRLAPGQKVEEIVPEFERLIREAAPGGADVQVDALVGRGAGSRAAGCEGDPARSRRVRAGSRPTAGARFGSAGRCRSCPRSPPRESRRWSPASACPTRSCTRRTNGSWRRTSPWERTPPASCYLAFGSL